jgi:hypothetical protein
VAVQEKMTGLGDVLAARERGEGFQEWRQGRGLAKGFVIYNSVGLGLQDAAMVEHLLGQQQEQST